MPTFYVGHRDVLRGRSDTPNTYTGLLGVYSNWDLMYTNHVLDGAPDNLRTPGVGLYNWGPTGTKWGGEGDVLLSGLFTGAQQALGFYASYKNNLGNAKNAVNPATVGYFYGAFPMYQYFGLTTNYSGEDGTTYGHRPIVNGANYGHLGYSPNLPLDASGNPIGIGPDSPYREWDYYYHGLNNNQALKSSTVGHVAHFTEPYTDQSGTAGLGEPWDSYTPAASFGSFQPYLYKGVNAAFGPGSPAGLGGASALEEVMVTEQTVSTTGTTGFGHYYFAAGSVGTTKDHYGDEHVREWFGVPSAQALNGGVPANGQNTPPVLAPKL